MRTQRLIAQIRKRGWQVFTREGELNIVGIRSPNTKPNRFDDQIHVFFREAGHWKHFIFPATTDPGTYWLNNPANPKGTAILAEQQALNAYQIDLHQGRYYALCQRREQVEVIRDYNRNQVLDFGDGRRERGYFGINIHRASTRGTTVKVDRWSAGCQVFARADDFSFFMRLCERHRKLTGANVFTYSLIDKRKLQSKRKRTPLLLAATALLGGWLTIR